MNLLHTWRCLLPLQISRSRKLEMAKEKPARGPGPCKLASGRDWVLRHRPEFEAGLAGKACAVLDQTQDWLDVYRGTRGAPPKTISSSSNGDRNGDWSSPRNTVLRNSTIHDFYGFPDPMYKLKYEAPGAIELGKRVKELLMGEGGMKRVDEDKNRGLDHGAWVPLMLMYPEADIPVCQLSVQSSQSGTYHYNMGKALAPLKDEGVLIIGSGSATHNLRKLDSNITNGSAVPWALAFDHWLRDSLLQGRYGDVNEWEEKAPNAKMAHPWPEHFYPLHVAMGAAGGDAKAEQIHTSWQLGTLSYSSYSFTSSL